MANRFLYLKRNNQNYAVPLITDTDKRTWDLVIAQEAMELPAYVERELAYYIYTSQFGKASSRIQDLTTVKLNPMQIDAAIENFKQTHPVREIAPYDMGETPVYADNDVGMELAIPGYNCVISQEQEKQLLAIIKLHNSYITAKPSLERWFEHYCERYGYDFENKCKGWQYTWLAEEFMEQHGIVLVSPPPPDPKSNFKKGVLKFLYYAFFISLLLLATVVDNVVVCMILAVVGMLGLGLPEVAKQNYK